MTRVKINGSWLTEESEIKDGVVNELRFCCLIQEGGDPTLVVCLLQGWKLWK